MSDKRLRVVLWITGVAFAISVLGVVVPWSWFESWLAVWGLDLGPPTAVLVLYVRFGYAVGGLIGVYFLILAVNPTAYTPFLKLGIAGLMFVGLVFLVAGLTLNMRPPWYLGDVLFCWIVGLLLFIWRPNMHSSALSAASPPHG